MRLVTIDFETYWDQDYTLSKMTTESYVRDERFTVLMVGVKVAGKPSVVLSHEDFRRALPLLRLEDSAVLCHHAHFDGFILSQHYGVRPRLFFDTLSMARSVYPNAKSNSLKALAERLGIGEKGHEVENTKGKRTLTPDEFRRLAAYCRNDVDLTYEIFQRLKPELPVSEYQLIDLTVKLFTDPILRLNKDLLREEQAAEIGRKEALLAACVSDRDTLSSNIKFAAFLESLGVVPPMKLSPAAMKRGEEVLTYAFGKSDEGFKALLSHDDETVRAVCEARLGVKSTINETRAARLLDVASRGPVPIYLTYWGAHTGRFSGGDKVNWQNMTRGSRLRLAVEAPPGYSVVVADLSQIEARVLAALAGEEALLESFRKADEADGDTDVYTDMASMVFRTPVTKKDKHLRQIGKAVTLGAGYSMGWKNFQQLQRVGMLGAPPNIFGKDMLDALQVDVDGFLRKHGNDVKATLPAGGDIGVHVIHCACSKAIVDMYRQANPAIVQLWADANDALGYCMAGVDFQFGAAPRITVAKDVMILPNGMKIRYTDLSANGREYSKQGKKHREKVYGGLCVENLVQALARVIMTDAMLKINKKYRVALTIHDEIVCCVPEGEAAECFAYMKQCMTTPPVWCPDIPLNCDGGFDYRYSK